MKTTLFIVTKNNAMSELQLAKLKSDLEAAGYEVITSFLSGLSNPMTDVRIDTLPRVPIAPVTEPYDIDKVGLWRHFWHNVFRGMGFRKAA